MASWLAELDTPEVIVDYSKVINNLEKCQTYCNKHRLKLRPHIKTHKIAEFAKLQKRLGACGITAQKLSEAEVMLKQGLNDILVTYNIIGEHKLKRLAALMNIGKITLVCDHHQISDGISQYLAKTNKNIDLFIECDTGGQRCGVTTPNKALELAKYIKSTTNLNFKGLVTYPAPNSIDKVIGFFDECVAIFDSNNISIPIISGGNTPDLWRSHEVKHYNEIRPGTYIYGDRACVHNAVCNYNDCALRVMATVVSFNNDNQFILDAGSKVITTENMGIFEDYGYIVEYPDAKIFQLYEEHGKVDCTNCSKLPKIGEIVSIIPNHVCVVSNLIDKVRVVKDGNSYWQNIDARGKIQ